MKNHTKYITDDTGAAHGLLHPSFYKKKAGSTGRFPLGAQSAKKGLGTTDITTPIPMSDMRNWGNWKTRVKSDFQLSTGLFSTLPAGRVGARLWLVGQRKPIKTVKNSIDSPASEPKYGLTDHIGASRNASFVQRGESGYSGITTSGSASQQKRGTGKNPDHPSDFLSTGLISALPSFGRAGARPRTRTPHPTIPSTQSPLQGAGGQGPVGWVKWKERRPYE